MPVRPRPSPSSALLKLAAALISGAVFACSGGSGGGLPDPIVTSPPDAGPGDPPPPPPPPPPPVTLDAPANGAVVAGQLDLSATAPAGTARVEFQVDGATVATVAATPFAAAWDSFSVANGAHAMEVRAIDGAGVATDSPAVQVSVSNHIRNVFVILLENHDWSSIQGSSSAPYINQTLLVRGAHANQYLNVPDLHPSLPNYIWIESGGTQGVADDAEPSQHPLSAPHLVSQLRSAGVSWKSYQEDIPGTDCPLTGVNQYAPKHNPMIYFTDVNSNLDRNSSECIAHVRPYTELARDLETDSVPAYSFITPNLCNDMHDCSIASGDAWLSLEVPKILASRAYKQGGALFITFDESAGSNVPIGFIALSPLARPGYANQVSYTHSSLLRSLQEIFGVSPLLGDAANATDLADLFRSFP
jgi:hypothetical protein